MLKTLSLLLLATFTAAQSTGSFKITDPSESNWWVAQSSNVLTWDCNNSPVNNFTVLIKNPNTPSPLAIIAQQQNDQCSLAISQDQANQPAGSGYFILFADPLNNTNVYTSSDSFEIKPLGSLYPSQAASSSAAVAATAASASAATASATPSRAAALSAHTPNFVGLAGAMGLLAASMFGA